jgi:hypothetical protein
MIMISEYLYKCGTDPKWVPLVATRPEAADAEPEDDDDDSARLLQF